MCQYLFVVIQAIFMWKTAIYSGNMADVFSSEFSQSLLALSPAGDQNCVKHRPSEHSEPHIYFFRGEGLFSIWYQYMIASNMSRISCWISLKATDEVTGQVKRPVFHSLSSEIRLRLRFRHLLRRSTINLWLLPPLVRS